MSFTKTDRRAVVGLFETEAAGLRWLAEAGGARTAQVHSVSAHHISIEKFAETRATAEAAAEFGRLLAKTHAAGAPAFGSKPPTAPLDHGFCGPTDSPLPMSYVNETSWGKFYANERIRPYVKIAQEMGGLSSKQAATIEAFAQRIADGEFDDGVAPARVHGDLWSGNLLWTPQGCVMIDPAAQGGHPVDDLALLDLFSTPHQGAIFKAYEAAANPPLPANWRSRIPMHQLFPLIFHAALFGSGYGSQAARIAASY